MDNLRLHDASKMVGIRAINLGIPISCKRDIAGRYRINYLVALDDVAVYQKHASLLEFVS